MQLDWRAIGFGVIVAIATTLPLAVLGQILSDYDDGGVSGVVFLFFFLVLAGLVAGGYVAGAKQPAAPLTHGIVAALGAYLLVQAIGLILNLARGDDVSPASIVVNAGLAAAMGLLGGLIASWRAAGAVPRR
jgi:putative membrane protein (TIGR04086 family)